MGELEEFCKEKFITVSSDWSGFDWKDERDRWLCTIHYDGRSDSFEFFTGIGWRKLAPGVKKEGNKYILPSGVVVRNIRHIIEGNHIRLQEPSVEDVLLVLLEDVASCEMTFDGWCDNLGYNNDSITHLNIYLACQRNGTKLIRLFSRELVNEMLQMSE